MRFLKPIVLLLILAVNIKCIAQHSKHSNKLDRKLYNKLIESGVLEYSKNDSVFVFCPFDNYILEEKRAIGERLYKYKEYLPNGDIYQEGMKFSEIKVGIRRKYSPDGKIIEEIDYDKDYRFTLKDLIKKAKEELGIDLDDNKYQVSRYINEGQPVYYIVSRINTGDNIKFVKINGTDGTIIINNLHPEGE